MGHDFEYDDEGLLAEALQRLLDDGELEGAEAGVTRQVVGRGRASLSTAQERVFQAVLRRHIELRCSRCDEEIPLEEIVGSWDNHGQCSWCVQVTSHDD